MKSILFFAAALLLVLPLRAQFQPSSLPESRIDGSEDPGIHIHFLNNYSYGDLPFSDHQSDLYVSTWRQRSTPSFYYKRTEANDPSTVIDEGFTTVPGASVIFDAVIVKNINSSSANQFGVAVVYSLVAGGGGVAFYEWTLTGLNLVKQFTFTNDVIASMRMDAINLTYYSVVYEVSGSHDLYAFGGDVTNSTYPLFSGVKQIVGNSSNTMGGFLPDVAMTKLSSPPPVMGTTGIKDYFAYIGLDQEVCEVFYLGFDELMSYASPITLSPEHTVSQLTFSIASIFSPCAAPNTSLPRFYYSQGPAIDAPDYSNDAWSVIVEQEEFYTLIPGCLAAPQNYYNRVIQLIVSAAYKTNGGTVQDIVLNDGSLPGTIDMSKNTLSPFDKMLGLSQPAVAFSNYNVGKWINYGWAKTEQNGAPSPNDYIGLVFDLNTSQPVSPAYRVIDYEPALNPYVRAVAFSGQNTTLNNLYTVFTADTVNVAYQSECIYQKHPFWTDIIPLGYKPTSVANIQDNPLNLQVQPNPFGDNFTLSVSWEHQKDLFEIWLTDALGRSILHERGYVNELNQAIQNDLNTPEELSSGLYFLRVQSLTAQQEMKFKLIKR